MRRSNQGAYASFLGGTLGFGMLVAGCIGPTINAPIDFHGQLQGTFQEHHTLYATTTSVQPSAQQQSNASRDANTIATISEIFSLASPTLGGQILFGGLGAYARTEAMIEGQKEAAGIVKGGLEKRSDTPFPPLQEGVSSATSHEFGKITLIVAPRFVDFNNNGKADISELQPSNRILRSTSSYFAFAFENERGVCNPEMKILDRNGRVIMKDNTWNWIIRGSTMLTPNALQKGQYFFAIYGEVLGNYMQPQGESTRYFIHAIPFEAVEE